MDTRPPTRPSLYADESGDDALRVAIRTAGSYSYLVAGDFDRCEQLLDEALEIAGDDHSAGNGIVIGCPYAWAMMGKGIFRRDACEYDAGEELFEKALRIAAEQGDPETESWTRGNLAMLLAIREDLDPALGLALRNYELTERLGDVFSRVLGADQPRDCAAGSAERRRMPSTPSSAGTACTARRWARAARPRPGERH